LAQNTTAWLTPEEVRRIIEAVPAVSLHPLRDQLLLEVIWQTGARVTEACTLTLGHIGTDTITLLNEKQTKRVKGSDDKWHRVHDPNAIKHTLVSPALCVRVKRYCLDSQIPDTGWIFPGNRDVTKPLSRDYVTRMVTRASEYVGIFRFGKRHPSTGGRYKGVYTHILRHSHASYLAAQGIKVEQIKELLGHSQIQSTMVYTHTNPQELRKSIQNIDWTGEGKDAQT
jgi:site-specific recombinase XerD